MFGRQQPVGGIRCVQNPPAGGARGRHDGPGEARADTRLVRGEFVGGGALCAVSAVSAALGARVQPVRMTVDVLLLSAPANVRYAAFLAALAAGVHNRKHVAHRLLMIILGLRGLYDVLVFANLRGHGDELHDLNLPLQAAAGAATNLVCTAILAVVLWMARDQFGARVQRASLPKALATLSALLTGFILIGWGLVDLFPD